MDWLVMWMLAFAIVACAVAMWAWVAVLVVSAYRAVEPSIVTLALLARHIALMETVKQFAAKTSIR